MWDWYSAPGVFCWKDYVSFLIFVIFSLCYYVLTRTKLLKNA
jgi:hypothetical protein